MEPRRLLDVILDVLLFILASRYCYIYYAPMSAPPPPPELPGDAAAVAVHDVPTAPHQLAMTASQVFGTSVPVYYRGSTVSLLLRPGQDDLVSCAGEDYRLNNTMNGKPLWQSDSLRRLIAFNGVAWVCARSADLESLSSGALRGQFFGGLRQSVQADTSFERSVWDKYEVRLSFGVEEQSAALGHVEFEVKPGHKNRGNCASKEYRASGELNGHPMWWSFTGRRLLAFNGRQWVCTSDTHFAEVQRMASKGELFGGFAGSNNGHGSLETSSWEDFMVKLE